MRFKTESKCMNLFARRRLLSFSSFIMAIVVGVVSSFTYTAAYDMACDALYERPQRVEGVWRGYWHGVPAVTIKLKQHGDDLSGTISFRSVVNTDRGPMAGEETIEHPLVNPLFDGKRLSFEIRGADDTHPPVFVEMEMSFENEEAAVLRSIRREPIDAPVDEEERTIKLRREGSF